MIKNHGCIYCTNYDPKYKRSPGYVGACKHPDNIICKFDAVRGSYNDVKRKEIHFKWNKKGKCKRYEAL